MSALDAIRRKIDRLDEELLGLLSRRGRLVQEIGALKARNGESVFAPGREREVLSRLKGRNPGPLKAESIEAVFREVMHACRTLQKELKIAYFGPEATFTHQAALKHFGRRSTLIGCRTISDVFAEVERRRADYGVVPIENSTEGVVNHTLDMFIESSLSICSEMEMPIHHYLLARRGPFRDGRGIRTLFSFPQALGQCRLWVESHLSGARVVEASSTAEAARLASKTPASAAIASRLAAELYGLEVLVSRVEDVSHNYTRFLVVGATEPTPTGRDKTTVMFSVKDRVGALHDILIPFKRHKLNMTKIESRPTRQRAWEYVFFVDFLGHRAEPRVQKALKELERSCVFLKILGSYPRSE